MQNLIFGLIGTQVILEPLIAWYLNGQDIDKIPGKDNETYSYDFVVIDPKEKCCYYTFSKGGYAEKHEPPIAFGVLDLYAEGILDCGYNAIDAMKMCIEKSCLLCGPIDVINTTKELAEGKYIAEATLRDELADKEVPTSTSFYLKK